MPIRAITVGSPLAARTSLSGLAIGSGISHRSSPNDAEQHRERGDEHNPARERVEEPFGRGRAVIVRRDTCPRDAQRVGDDGDRNRAQRDRDAHASAADR